MVGVPATSRASATYGVLLRPSRVVFALAAMAAWGRRADMRTGRRGHAGPWRLAPLSRSVLAANTGVERRPVVASAKTLHF